MFLANAFSLNMLAVDSANINVKKVSIEEARSLLNGNFESCVGHADTAALFSGLLGRPVPANRSTLQLESGVELVVGQYTGPRLAEGTPTLPEGAAVTWFHVTL